MRGNFARFVLLLLAGALPVRAIAMSGPAHPDRCRVISGEKLPASAGGPQAICAAVERAVAAQAPNVRFSAEVRVVTPSMLATKLIVNGRALPEHKFAVMDRKFTASSIGRFAESVAESVAKAARS